MIFLENVHIFLSLDHSIKVFMGKIEVERILNWFEKDTKRNVVWRGFFFILRVTDVD